MKKIKEEFLRYIAKLCDIRHCPFKNGAMTLMNGLRYSC